MSIIKNSKMDLPSIVVFLMELQLSGSGYNFQKYGNFYQSFQNFEHNACFQIQTLISSIPKCYLHNAKKIPF